MIDRVMVTSLKVLDQDEALDFYVNKLGFEVAQDFEQGPIRWLTVRVPGDTSLEIYLEKPGPPAHDEATTTQLRELISKGAVGWIAVQTKDCREFYEQLKSRGVSDFTQEPTEHLYGTDMGVRDPSGNAIRILQPAKAAVEATA